MSPLTKRSLLFSTFLLPTALTQSCPWTIELRGNADYKCGVTGSGWSVQGGANEDCKKGSTICAGNLGDLTPGGGKIQLMTPQADPWMDPPGTLIECTFTNGAHADQVSNCDISMVDGYNYDVYCYGDLVEPMGYENWSPPQENPCSGPDAEFNAKAGVCKNLKGASSDNVNDVNAFFRACADKKGIYVAANQVGPMVNVKQGYTGGKIICEVNGGKFGTNLEEGAPAGAEASPVEKRNGHAHRLRHARRVHGHPRGLGAVIGAGKA